MVDVGKVKEGKLGELGKGEVRKINGNEGR